MSSCTSMNLQIVVKPPDVIIMPFQRWGFLSVTMRSANLKVNQSAYMLRRNEEPGGILSVGDKVKALYSRIHNFVTSVGQWMESHFLISINRPILKINCSIWRSTVTYNQTWCGDTRAVESQSRFITDFSSLGIHVGDFILNGIMLVKWVGFA